MDNGLAKQHAITNWSEHGFKEYQLVVQPSKAVLELVMEERHHLFMDYQQQAILQHRPMIRVADFLAKEEMEDTLTRWLERICYQQQSFTVTLNNYSGFPPHTIYIRVQDPEPFERLTQHLKTIDDFIRSSDCPPAGFTAKPHLSIAGELPATVYQKAMVDYSQKIFHESFAVNELFLLKRHHSFDVCKVISVFHFSPNHQQPYGKVA